MTAPAYVIAHHDASALAPLAPDASLALRAVRAWRYGYWLRSAQCPPPGRWRSWGQICGRGNGKTFGLGVYLNRSVERGHVRRPAIMGPTVQRVKEVMVSALVETSPPWFRAEAYGDGVRWPNGVIAEAFSSEAPDRPRGGNFDFGWMCELVNWLRTGRLEGFKHFTTAVRVGRDPQYVWDTTSKGRNDVIRFLIAQHARDPSMHRLTRGTMFDNPFLSRDYLRDEVAKYVRGSRRYGEEVLGEVHDESAGALWSQDVLDTNRVALVPSALPLVIVGVDPGLSERPEADETGLVEAGRDEHGHVFVTRDESDHHAPERWGDVVVERCLAGAAGAVVETNHLGAFATANIRARAKERGLRVEVIERDRPFPRRTPGVVYVREVVSRVSKGGRAHPVASLYDAGRVHHVGTFDELEDQQTTWEPDEKGESPNRLDALCEVVTELTEVTSNRKAPPPAAVRDAAQANREIASRLRRIARRAV